MPTGKMKSHEFYEFVVKSATPKTGDEPRRLNIGLKYWNCRLKIYMSNTIKENGEIEGSKRIRIYR